jgi:hypothetical protein
VAGSSGFVRNAERPTLILSILSRVLSSSLLEVVNSSNLVRKLLVSASRNSRVSANRS